MRALVTGSSGFIGSRIARYLELDGHEVVGADLQGSPSRDIRELRLYDHLHYDLVIHCAALVGGRARIENSPVEYAANLEIDAALFQWAERARPGRVAYISSVAAYPACLQQILHQLEEGDIGGFHYPEEPDKMYGWAKLTGEYLASQSGVPVSISRPFTVYGKGQAEVFPFANLLRQVRERRDPVEVWGSGNQIRDFIHVDDVACAIIAMAQEGIDGPVNLCTGRPVSLNEVARMMANVAGYNPEIAHLRDKPEGLWYRVGSPVKLREFYIPRISLEEGVVRGLK